MKATKKPRKRAPKQAALVAQIEADIPEPTSNPVTMLVARLKRRKRDIAFTRTLQTEMLDRMCAGEFPAQICLDAHMPTFGTLRATLAASEEFAAEFGEAVKALADAVLNDAAEFSRQSAALNNDKASRVAEIYTRSMIAALEKLAPKSHGALVKLGDPDAKPLTVGVINYAKEKPQDAE